MIINGDKLLEIINHYGVLPQLKYFQSEVFELNEAIIKFETLKDYYFKNTNWLKDHIAEEIADCYVMLEQFRLHYDIDLDEVKNVGRYKIDRQLERIKKDD